MTPNPRTRIVRLFNTGENPDRARLRWARPAPKEIWLSNLAEEKVRRITGQITVGAYEIATIRAEI